MSFDSYSFPQKFTLSLSKVTEQAIESYQKGVENIIKKITPKITYKKISLDEPTKRVKYQNIHFGGDSYRHEEWKS